MWLLYDRDGQIAVTLGWQTDWLKPIRVRISYVGKAAVVDWPGLVGKRVRFTGDVGVVHIGCVSYTIDTGDAKNWECTTETQGVKKPRRGKRHGMKYDWEWHNGKWDRFWV